MGYGGIVIANDTLGDLWFRGNLLWDNYMQGANLLHSINANTLRPTQNGRHFADDMFKWIFLNENVWIPIEISLKFVPKGPINNIPALIQKMAWRQTGDKPLSEPMMTQFNDAYMRHWASMSQLQKSPIPNLSNF